MGAIMQPRGSKGAMVFEDQNQPWKVYGAIGDGARAWALRAGIPADDTTNSPTEFIATQVGTSPTTVGSASGYPLLITTGGTEYNGSNLQLRGETAKLTSTRYAVLRGKIKLDSATESDFLFGLCELKTDLLKTSVAHGVLATGVEGVFFFKVDGATAIQVKAYKDGSETTSVAVGTMTTSDIDYALIWDGATVRAFINDALVAQFAGTLPDGDLTPSINVRAGSGAAVTASFAELAYVSLE
jgi:hypothetical protein